MDSENVLVSREFLREVDGLLSILVYRHGGYIERIGELDTAKRLIREALTFAASSPPIAPATPVEILPENFWRDVWHTNCFSALPSRMLRRPEITTIEDGSTLHRYKCVLCDAQVYGGLDKNRRVVTRDCENQPE
jgi:hypothetical protein